MMTAWFFYDGLQTDACNTTASRGMFLRNGSYVYFVSGGYGQVVPALFDGVEFGAVDRPQEGNLFVGITYMVDGLTSRRRPLDDERVRELTDICDAPLAFVGAISSDVLAPAPPPLLALPIL